MRFICRLDRSIYSCVTEHIASDAVVITEKQAAHIFENHPQREHADVIARLSDIVRSPDYILRDDDPRIAVVLKSFQIDGVRYRVILKLASAEDQAHACNSILTAFFISGKKMAKYLRNKKVLYRRPGI